MKRLIVELTLLIFALIAGCQESRSSSISENLKEEPRIEFIECQNSSPDHSLGRKTFVNKREVEKDGVRTVSFDFVNNCCLEFTGKWKLENEVLTLSYYPSGEVQEPCDCKCLYTMKYHFKSDDYSWYRVKVRKRK